MFRHRICPIHFDFKTCMNPAYLTPNISQLVKKLPPRFGSSQDVQTCRLSNAFLISPLKHRGEWWQQICLIFVSWPKTPVFIHRHNTTQIFLYGPKDFFTPLCAFNSSFHCFFKLINYSFFSDCKSMN